MPKAVPFNPMTGPAERSDFNGGLDRPSPPREEPHTAGADAQAIFGLDAGLIRIYRLYARFAGIGAAGLGGQALLGWIAGIPTLTNLHPGWVTMKANTAIAFLVAGFALFLAVPIGGDRQTRSVVVQVCAVLVAAIGLLSLAEIVFGDLGIDQLLIAEAPVVTGTVIPGRMPPMTASGFALFGLALLAQVARRDSLVSVPLALLVLVCSALMLTAYLFGAEEVYSFSGHFNTMAFPTALAFLLLSSGLLVIGSERGPLRWLASPRSGGVMLRRLLPVVIFGPVLTIWLRFNGQAAGLLGTVEFGAAIAAVANIILFSCPLLWAVAQLDRTDAIRLEGEASRLAARYARSLIEASLDPLVTINVEGKITDVNEATVQATGVSREQLTGSDFVGYFTDPEAARVGYKAAFANGSVTGYPLSIKNSSGITVDVLCNAATYRGVDGNIVGVVVGARDFSERKRVEEEVRRLNAELEQRVQQRTADLSAANEKLEAAAKELETFAYSVSHDLRAPLRAIDGFCHILLEDYADKLDAEGQRLFRAVRGNAVRMGQLIEDILAFSHAGRAEITRTLVDMEALARSVIKDLEPAAGGRNVSFDVGSLPPAYGDPAMIQRVWENLIDNAIKYSGPKPVARIEIGATTGSGENTYFVRDNGVGFDMKYIDKLFGVFMRLHGAEFPGNGIGLAIVSRIVSRHGGHVRAEGKLNEGATIYFSLPTQEERHA